MKQPSHPSHPPSGDLQSSKAINGNHYHLCPANMYMSKTKSLCIVLAITIGAVGLLFKYNRQGYYLTHNIGLTSSIDKKKDIFHLRTPKEADGAFGSNEDDGEEPHAALEKSDEFKASPFDNISPADASIEQKSRAFPIWIDDKRRAVDNSNTRPYGWCVSEDLATNDVSPKGLLFVKVHKSGSSTGAGVTLRIRDGLSRRLTHLNETAPGNCFAHYNHATASELRFEKRDPSQSFLWSIVREPAQRTLSYYFFYHISKQNYTATEDMILAILKSSKGQNYQSKYLDLPSQNNEQSSSSAERIINGYDFVAVNERMQESLVVLAMLAQIPLTDVVVFSSKIAGGFGIALGKKGCVKLKNKWTTPKIEEYIHGDYQSANKDDYLLYKAAQRSLDKTIDALGRHRVEENVKLLRSLQQQNEEQCASKVTMPCPEPDDAEKKREHIRLVKESCYFSDIGCGHACTDEVLADYAEKEWASMTSSYGQG